MELGLTLGSWWGERDQPICRLFLQVGGDEATTMRNKAFGQGCTRLHLSIVANHV
jgi:hypothetical protein